MELDSLHGEPIELYANDTLVARGEVVVVGEQFGVRITEIATQRDRIVVYGKGEVHGYQCVQGRICRRGRDYLQALNNDLLDFEKDPANKAILDEMFRAAHSLKGMAGTMVLTNWPNLHMRWKACLISYALTS